MTSRIVDVLIGISAVRPHLQQVRTAADANTNALGFFPVSVYEEFARRDQLYVAVVRSVNGIEYAGHVLFDRRYPRAHVLQMYCAESWRRHGVANCLLSKVISVLTAEGFLSLQARVAEDLQAANEFWASNGLYVQRTEPGKGQRLRLILVRVLELDSPQLFPRSGLSQTAENPLGLRAAATAASPIYLIDLNVLFDLARSRIRHELARNLFRAANAGAYRVAVSDEMDNELRRTARIGVTDPMLEFIGTLPQFPGPTGATADSLTDQLARMVFPEKYRQKTLTDNDRSDLRHLATAIWNGLSGFITSDNAMLHAQSAIAAQFNLQVLSPEAFEGGGLYVAEGRDVITSSDALLTLRYPTSDDEPAIRDLLKRHGVAAETIAGQWVPLDSTGIVIRIGIWVGATCIGYLVWTDRARQSAPSTVRAIVSDGHPEAVNAARLLFRTLTDALTRRPSPALSLELPIHQSVLREEAHRIGFFSSSGSSTLTKIAVGNVMTAANWRTRREILAKATHLRLPEAAPAFRSATQIIDIFSPDGNRRHLALDALETYLSPVLLCLPNRPAVITPIQRRFSEPLFKHSKQQTLLPEGSAALHRERTYLSGPNTLKHLSRGTLVLFYESGENNGRQAIVAMARITESFLRRQDALTDVHLERSVLTPSSLAEIGTSPNKAVSAIDNIFALPEPVGLATLRTLGCGTGGHLITTRPINDQQLTRILVEGFDHE